MFKTNNIFVRDKNKVKTYQISSLLFHSYTLLKIYRLNGSLFNILLKDFKK